jgi:hypothetical protein
LAVGMDSTAASDFQLTHARTRPGTGVTVVGALVALCCIGFAGVNIVLEITDRFADSTYAQYVAEYPVGFTVMNWLVVALKVIGAAVAVLSVTDRPRLIRPAAVGVLVWAAFATLGVYALGSVVEGVGMVLGLAGRGDQSASANVGYVLFFLLFAAGFGVLAISYSRRHHMRKGHVLLGLVGAPMVLGLVLFAVPTSLAAFGLLPTA